MALLQCYQRMAMLVLLAVAPAAVYTYPTAITQYANESLPLRNSTTLWYDITDITGWIFPISQPNPLFRLPRPLKGNEEQPQRGQPRTLRASRSI